MPLTITCPLCKQPSQLSYDDINKVEDTYGATIDCRNNECCALLYSSEEKGIVPFHLHMNEETNGLWDKDGKNAFYMEIKKE